MSIISYLVNIGTETYELSPTVYEYFEGSLCCHCDSCRSDDIADPLCNRALGLALRFAVRRLLMTNGELWARPSGISVDELVNSAVASALRIS